MKQVLTVGFNFQKVLKSCAEDKNVERVFAECNIVLSETAYDLTNSGDLVKGVKVSEVEFCVDRESAKQLRDLFDDVVDKIEGLEDKEQERDEAQKNYTKRS